MKYYSIFLQLADHFDMQYAIVTCQIFQSKYYRIF